MSDPNFPADDGSVAKLLRGLLNAPGAALYSDVFPRLDERHLRFLADEGRTPRMEAALLLTAAGRSGPADPAAAMQRYRDDGELPSLKRVADADTVARTRVELQRKTDDLIGKAESRAALYDGEGVRCRGEYLTWAKRVKWLREQAGSEYADNPASQIALVEACLAEMNEALEEEKHHLQSRLAKAIDELAQKKDSLEEKDAVRARDYAEAAGKLIAADNLFLALHRLGLLEGVLAGRAVRLAGDDRQRLPRPRRRNPLGRNGFHFESVTAIARQGTLEVARRGLAEYFPNETTVEEAKDPSGFLIRHAVRRVPDWGAYFASLRDWLGLDDPRARQDDRRRGRGRMLQRLLDMPNLEPKGEKLPGRWIFLPAEPWQGAPYYEDIDGRPRVVAIVRLAVSDASGTRPQVIQQHVNQALSILLVQLLAETDDERRFRQNGLVIVLLPGDTLLGKKYEQFRQQIQLEKTAPARRIAFLDDLDLLRLLPVSADDRFRALLELALPRFPDSLSQTYQNSDAVRPRMFFGRSDELDRLEPDNGATVVFSGRKMGKSSLLSRLQAQCTVETHQRAVLVGCSGIASGRSWTVLWEIERELDRLFPPGAPRSVSPAAPPLPRSIEDPAGAMQVAKERFRGVLDEVMLRLERDNVRRLYVLLDEADNFVRAELEETSGDKDPRRAVSWFLRDLQTSTYRGRLRFIFAGFDQVGRIFRDSGLGQSAFGNWGGAPLKLGPLDPAAAQDLVAKPLTALGMIVSDDLVARILDYTSGHASLIQAFCRKLAERVRENQADWPLNDVPVEFEDVRVVADEQRGAGDQNYRQLLEQTLGLNLDIARAYPLKLVFLALVSPDGLGAGQVLGWNPFTFEDALEQLRVTEGEPAPDLAPTLVLDSLDLLAQLGLLDDVSDSNGRGFVFKARHFVNVLRTKNGFRDQLRQALDEWQQPGRRANQVEPRYVWTLSDSDLRTLRQDTPRPAVVVGLPGSGRQYLAGMLASSRTDEESPHYLESDQADFESRLTALLAVPSRRPVIVADPGDAVEWGKFSAWLRQAAEIGLPLRWVGGPRLAWDLAGDVEVALLDVRFVSWPPVARSRKRPRLRASERD